MSLLVNDDAPEAPWAPWVKPYFYSITPFAELDCRTCIYAGFATCTLSTVTCVRGDQYVEAKVLQFWRK